MQHTDRLIGESSVFLEALEHVSLVAPLTKPVLIVGERGTGKEHFAARVHYLSTRWDQPLLKLNSATLSDTLLDSELFGHEAGAFSGAVRQHQGFFERASGGSLFLDELATTSSQVQEKILRVIEYGELTRVGGKNTVEVDVRLIAATNEHLPSLARQGKFREDLLDRLSFDVVTLPPLRYREEDVVLLAEFFALGIINELQRDYFPGFTAKALEQLKHYTWPGNVRELKNVIERSIYRSQNPAEAIDELIFDPFKSQFSQTTAIARDPVASEITESVSEPQAEKVWQSFVNSQLDYKTFFDQQEIEVLNCALKHCQYNQKQTAEFLGFSYHQLRSHLRKYGIK